MPNTSTLVETFDTLDTSGVWPTSYGGVSAVDGRGRVTAAAGTYAGIVSANAYTLNGNTLGWQMYPLADPGTATEAYSNGMFESTTEGTRVGFYLRANSGTLVMVTEVGYNDATPTTITFDPVAHAYVQLDATGANLLWRTSPDGTTWTTRRTLAKPAWVTSATDGRISYGVFKSSGAKTYAEYDNVNVVPSAPPAPVVDPAPIFGQINGGPHTGAGRRVPLTVRLTTTLQDIHVTAEIADIEIRSVVPGGFASCTIRLQRPLAWQPAEIDYYARMTVYDTRNGLTVWEGRLEDPGRSAGGDGEVWEINGVGPSAYAEDRVAPIVYIDSFMDSFMPTPASRKYASIGNEQSSSDQAGIKLHAPQSTYWGINSYVQVGSFRLADSGGRLARVQGTVECGATDGNWLAKLVSYPSNTVLGSVALNSSTFNLGSTIMSGIPSGDSVFTLRMERIGYALNVASDDRWTIWYDWHQVAILRDRNGNDITTGYNTNTVYAHQIVIDLLGGFLGGDIDAVNARVDTTYQPIDQLLYPDGASPGQIFADLMVLEPAYFWAAWERTASTGKHRFEWRPWPSEPRYEAEVADGFDSPASAANLFNRSVVIYQTGTPRRRAYAVQTSVPALDDVGLIRERPINLGEELGSASNAARAGQGWLAENANPPNAGTLLVARPILDLEQGRMVAPWEIRPGTLIRVRGVMPRPGVFNASGRDGVTVFRIVAVTYSSGSNTASLELDSYPSDVAHALADLTSRTSTRSR